MGNASGLDGSLVLSIGNVYYSYSILTMERLSIGTKQLWLNQF